MSDVQTESVRDYWNNHPLGTQYSDLPDSEIGTSKFFDEIKPWMNPYKFPDVMPRIDREAEKLKGCHILEVGCGLGFDTVEWLSRGVRVTAVDLSPVAVGLTRKHLDYRGLSAEAVQVENALDLSFEDNTFDAVYSIGVLHHTGDTARAIREVHRVIKPNGRAIVCHLYRRPSWFHFLSKLGKENIEFKDQDPPVIDFYTEEEVLDMFAQFEVEQLMQDHYRALPIARKGFMATMYRLGFRPAYNLLPTSIAKRFAHKISVIADKR
ncbi:MAG: class I SAM-dependent methyltransferase [Pseudomonadota bacterium]